MLRLMLRLMLAGPAGLLIARPARQDAVLLRRMTTTALSTRLHKSDPVVYK